MTSIAGEHAASYLLFDLRDALYGVETLAIRELLLLPELTPLEEMPAHIVGVVNLRGRVVPVMNLHLRLGHACAPYRLSDVLVVLEHAGMWMGVIVDGVRDTRDIAREHFEPTPAYGANSTTRLRFVTALAKLEDDIVMILDVEKLIHLSMAHELPAPADLQALGDIRDELTYDTAKPFFPDATPEQRRTLRERAHALAQASASDDSAGLIQLAVVDFQGEHYGAELNLLWGLAGASQITPLPSCPAHVVGLMNLRGDILTVVDLRGLLGLQASRTGGKVLVVQVAASDGTVPNRIGVLADEVLDVLQVRPTDLAPLPAAVRGAGEEYVKGTVPYGEAMLTVLDLKRVLEASALIVDESE